MYFQRNVLEESSDDEVGSESPLDEVAMAPELSSSSAGGSVVLFPPSSLSLQHRRRSDNRSDTRYFSSLKNCLMW